MALNAALELHDSRVAEVVVDDGFITNRLRPAYLHRSEGRPGHDAGTGWVQDVDLVLADARIEAAFSELPQFLEDGSLRIGGQRLRGLIPLPLSQAGEVDLSLAGMADEWLVVHAQGITVVEQSEARFVEDVPGTGNGLE